MDPRKTVFLWSEPMPVLARTDEGFDHLGIYEIAVELIQLR
jgi:hypothetical protein